MVFRMNLLRGVIQLQDQSCNSFKERLRQKGKYLGWRVSKVKEDMKSGEISHQGAVRAVPRVECKF